LDRRGHRPCGRDEVPGAAAIEVTESFALSDSLIIRAYWTLFGARRTKTNVRGMRQTLERIRAVVEAI
jgi:hypothetical protein